ncbi:cell division protein CrgA [Pseudolysinimonas sp.]|uniref:cell division protein CrgA n=1 Tax=Pseudolysinimonas sp. TaxID=2680009 RepID=UPI0037832471
MARPKSPNPEPKASPSESGGRENLPNPVWFKPIMFGFMLLGLTWIIVYYLSQGSWPIPGINEANIAIGFGFLIIGFFMTTRWR